MAAASTESLSGIRKTAILLVSLGSDISAEIFKHLSDREVEKISLEIARLETVDSDLRQDVLEEFAEMLRAQQYISQGGMDAAQAILTKALGEDKARDMIDRLTSAYEVRPFEFIRHADPAHILNFIQGEHPQTIALVLAYLDSETASNIIQEFPPELQADVSKRIALMDRTSPEMIREVERVLERKLSSLVNEEYASTGGIEAMVEVLNHADRSTEKSILETLDEQDPELAEEIRRKLFVFEDIVQLDDASVQRVLREVDQDELALALKAVEANVQDKIFDNMSKRAAGMLREELEYMGPVRLRDVEEAQQQIVNVIRRLEEEGEIVVARGGGEEIVA
ncbi:MAG: flagellar motor switch protein FliG [bacterium]